MNFSRYARWIGVAQCLVIGLGAFFCLTGCKEKPAPPPPSAAKMPTEFSITNLPYYISNAGTYRVTADLVGQKGFLGIDIQTNNVVVDLNHKQLIGGPNAGAGILFRRAVSNVVVLNGTISKWGHGISGLFANGCVFSNLNIISNEMGMTIASFNVIERCVVSHSVSSTGMTVHDKSVLRDCRSENNNGDGFVVGHEGVVENCQAISNSINGFFGTMTATFTNCVSAYNQRSGIYTRASSRVSGSTIEGNRFEGIELASGCTVDNNLVQSNINNGIHIFGHGTVVSNRVIGNKRDGIRAAFNNRIINNYCEGNARDGRDTGSIHAILKFNRIENNLVIIDEAIGIKAKDSPNQILGNTVRHRASSGGLAYECKPGNLPTAVLQREKAAGDPPNANYELLSGSSK